MRHLGFICVVGLALAAFAFSTPAVAACTCICVDGKPKAQCPSVLETAICPASVCAGEPQRAAPPITRKEDCTVVQGVNPATNRIERRLECK